MPCDPNTLLEQAKCLNTCIPPGMMGAVQTSLLCQIADAGGGGGGGEFVLKAGDTMTGLLTIEVTTADPVLVLNSIGSNRVTYVGGSFQVVDAVGDDLFVAQGGDSSIGFFAGGPATLQTSGANLTNNVTAGGTDNTIDNFTSLTVYATDAAAIRNDIYQLARKLKQINDGLRAYGLFT